MEYNQIPLQDFIEIRTGGGIDEIQFKKCLQNYVEKLREFKNQNEKAIVSNVLAPFLQDLGFIPHSSYKQKGNSEIDLALLKDNQVEIIIEAKKPNSKEFFEPQKPNCKALHECVLYYLRERQNNIKLKFIIITDFFQFFIFSAKEFERYFYRNKAVQDLYKIYLDKGSLIANQQEFYTELEKILNKEFKGDREGNLFNHALKGTYFEVRESKNLKYAHQILSREFLHNEFKKDANVINKAFYNELLHILGLKESSQNGKILITFDDMQEKSFAKHIYEKLPDSCKKSDEEAKESTMSHIIIWLNRILFLKLLEASLLKFNDYDERLKFLTNEKIKSFNELYHLFFEILGKEYKERKNHKGFSFLPYLNSSLFKFEKNKEKEILSISELDDDYKIEFFKTSILYKEQGYKDKKEILFLTYLFNFLESYKFTTSVELEQDKLIDSSVLGSVFEKLNGYKEGSFYTPSFITSYMCKEALQKIVCEKFNALNPQWQVKTLKDIKEEIRQEIRDNRDKQECIKEKYTNLLKSIKICDPAVGSGHFLVSALNEMIRIYFELGLLESEISNLELHNNELMVETEYSMKDENEEKENMYFEYKRPQSNKELQHKIQKKLFTLKKDIIENNLFGVDINPNSCEIARLRLWIELLKHSYYVDFKDKDIHKLETLPNIDINIKCGNSLVSYFDINQSLTHYPNIKQKMQEYKNIVKDYKEGFYESKMQIDSKIKDLLETFRNFCFKDKFKKEVKAFEAKCENYSSKYGNHLAKDDKNLAVFVSQRMFVHEFDESEALKAFEALKKSYDEIFNLEINKPFEWRFAFPEILDENGNFKGFDLIIGNPPYIKEPDNKELFKNTKNLRTYQGKMDIWYHFVGRGFDILKNNGILTFIATNNWTTNAGAKRLRNVILTESQILNLVDFGSYMVFDSASIQTMIMEFKKKKPTQNYDFLFSKISNLKPTHKHALMLLEKIEFEDNITLYNIDFTPEKFIDKTLNFNKNSYDDILNKIESIKNFNLNEKEIAQGIVYPQENVNKKSLEILGKNFYIGQGIQKLTNEEIKKLKLLEREKNLLKPIFESNNIEKYFVEKDNDFWVIYTNSSFKNPNSMDKYPNLKKHLDRFKDVITSDNKPYGLHRARDESFFTGSPRIIALRKCVGEPKFSYVDFDCYVSATFYVIKTQRISLKYLTGLLNSKLVAFWLKYKGKMQGNNYQIDKEPLHNIPFVNINSKNQKIADKLINLVDEILKSKAKNTKADTSTLEKQIDNLVYKLYNLSEEEIKIIEEKG